MADKPRRYTSSLRDDQAQATRERIITATLEMMQSGDEGSIDAIAKAAGVERRTVFRHFASREALLVETFKSLNARIGADLAPSDPASLTHAIRKGFARMDAYEGAIRAALHSRAGREMRALTLPGRRAAFAASLAGAELPADQRRRIEALAHLLYSASAWEVLKDYGELTGSEAGEVAAWALEVLLSASTSAAPPADRPTD